MFVGYLHCEGCGYKNREFMLSHHPFRPHDVLFQHEATHKIRIKQFPDDDAFYQKDEIAIGRYFAALEREHAKPGERIIRFSFWGEEDAITELLCPKCPDRLSWKVIGIA